MADELLQRLKDTVIDLVQVHNVKHKTIKKEIYNYLKELSDKLPKIQVLYNGVYGGYGYSKQFSEYIDQDQDHNSKSSRISHISKIKEFGAICKSSYSFVTKLIAIYNKYDLGKVFTKIAKLENNNKEITKYNEMLKLIQETDDNLFGSDDITYMSCYYSQFLKHDKQKLITYIQNELQKLQSQDLQIPEFILENYNVVFDKEIQYHKYNMKITKEEGVISITFIDAINEYAEVSFGIWTCQNYYDKKAMRFLIKYYDRFETDINYCTDLEMGLLCANSQYCKLCIGEAPQLLDWYIGEYDGLESIVVKP
jgi:hypothetical protein